MGIYYNYYDYTPSDAVTFYVTTQPRRIRAYNRDGVYLGTITDDSVLARLLPIWKAARHEAMQLALVVICEVKPELIKHEEDALNLPDWHPALPPRPTEWVKSVQFLNGPHAGKYYRSTHLFRFLVMRDQNPYEKEDTVHLHELHTEIDEPCGYVHLISGKAYDVQRYCIQNSIPAIDIQQHEGTEP